MGGALSSPVRRTGTFIFTQQREGFQEWSNPVGDGMGSCGQFACGSSHARSGYKKIGNPVKDCRQ